MYWESGTVPTGAGTRTGTVPYLGSQRGVLLDVVLPLEVDVHVARGVVGPAERARHLLNIVAVDGGDGDAEVEAHDGAARHGTLRSLTRRKVDQERNLGRGEKNLH